MRLKVKKTGEIIDSQEDVQKFMDEILDCDTLADFDERFEDAPQYGGRMPKDRDDYWFINTDGTVRNCEWGDSPFDHSVFEAGNAFWTEEDAERELARRKAYVVLKGDTKGFKPDWEDGQEKYYVFWETSYQCLRTSCFFRGYAGEILFATKEDAVTSIKAHEKEWKIWLGTEEL